MGDWNKSPGTDKQTCIFPGKETRQLHGPHASSFGAGESGLKPFEDDGCTSGVEFLGTLH